jgi:nickel transport protein
MQRNCNNKLITGSSINIARTALLLVLSLVLVLATATPALAHGTKFEYQARVSYEILATYDDGTPMSKAQVTVYAPNEPSKLWTTGTCDENGRYVLTPDTSITGEWTVQIRKAGHGGMLNIPVGENNQATTGSTGYTPVQLAIMIIAVLWGLLGTGLYFKREKK